LYCLPPVFMTAYIRIAPKEGIFPASREEERETIRKPQKVVNNFISLAAHPDGEWLSARLFW
jgi:hypothetical protein